LVKQQNKQIKKTYKKTKQIKQKKILYIHIYILNIEIFLNDIITQHTKYKNKYTIGPIGLVVEYLIVTV